MRTTTDRPAPTEPDAPPGPTATPGRLVEAATIASGVGWALVVGADGSTPWRLVRVAVVAALTAGLVLAGRRHPGRAVEHLRLVVATVGVTAGAVLGLRYLGITGVSATAVGGLVLLVAGAVLGVATAGHLFRSTHGWWRLLGIPVAIGLLLFVAYPVGIALFATNVPRPEADAAALRTLGPDAEEVSLETADGVTLHATYLPSRDGAAVVLAHGASSTRSAVVAQAKVLADAGYGVLLLDARGHGDSGGRAMDLGWFGDLDVTAAVDHLAARDDVDPDRIGAVGMSMGGEEVIGAAAADRRIAVVVAEGATNRTREDKAWLPTGPTGWLQRGMDVLTFGLTDLLTDASPPISLRDAVAATAPRPVLLLAGEGEEDAAAHIAAGSPGTVEVIETGAGHVAGLRADPEAWERAVVGALDAALAP